MRLLILISALALTSLSSSNTAIAAKTEPGEPRPRIYKVTEVDRKPEVIRKETPKEPKRLLGAEASVAVLVDSDGAVIQVQLAKASDKEFGENAVEAAKKFAFTPAMKDGVPVRCVVILPFGFGMRIRTER